MIHIKSGDSGPQERLQPRAARVHLNAKVLCKHRINWQVPLAFVGKVIKTQLMYFSKHDINNYNQISEGPILDINILNTTA